MSTPAVFDSLLQEEREFPPPAGFAEKAAASDMSLYKEGESDPLKFWARMAGELEWFEPWKEVMTWTPPTVKWFEGGKLNY